MPVYDEGATAHIVNVEVVASLRVGLYWQGEERAWPGLSLEVAPQLTRVFDVPVGPIVGGYVQGRAVLGHGFSASAGGRAGLVWANFYDCIGFMEWPGVKGELGRLWTREGSGWEAGGELNVIVGGMELAYTRLTEPAEEHGFRAHLGWALPLLPACAAGRPLRTEGAALLPAVAWRGPERGTDAETLRWIRRGREEHASVGAFLRLATELGALGAPAALIGGALRAASEEAGHARLCFGQAAARAQSPLWVRPVAGRLRRWPRRTEGLVTLASESWLDGVVGEGRAAHEAQDARDAVRDEVVAAIEDRIAAEEAGHARLGADVLDWCLREGGEPVRRVLARTEARL